MLTDFSIIAKQGRAQDGGLFTMKSLPPRYASTVFAPMLPSEFPKPDPGHLVMSSFVATHEGCQIGQVVGLGVTVAH